MTKPKQITKTSLATKLGVSRSSLYYRPKLPDGDEEIRHQDVYTKEIVDYHLSRHHQSSLVLSALEDAFSRYNPSLWIHSDQGSEYNSIIYTNRCRQAGINISISAKASPWQNPFQESFYDKFKITLGFLDRFENVGELIAGIREAVYYYNNKRIHSALKMSPVVYRQILTTKSDRQLV